MATLTSRVPARNEGAARRDPSGAQRCAPSPRGWVVRTSVVLLGVGFGATLALAVTGTTWSQVRAPGGAWIFLGSLTGLAGTYLALVMVLLVSRVPMVERVLGQDGLVRSHRRLAPWPISLLVAHLVALTIGYAQASKSGLWQQFGSLTTSFPDVLPATVGLFLMVGIALVSIRAIRRRIPRERWWAMHLLMYLALALAFAHVIALGPAFVGHPLTQALWTALWIATAGVVIAFRIGLPVLRTLRHQLRVVEVREETPGVVTVVCRGRRIERLAVSGGQFFEWRFLSRGMWWQAHPFSLSAMPRPPYLRLTVQVVGDFTAAVARLRPGTRVAIEGPYGAFTRDQQGREKVVLIAGGVGVTAVRSLLEDLPPRCEPVVVLRASRTEDLLFSREVAALVRKRKGRVHELVGSRSSVDLHDVADLIPDITDRDAYVAGSRQFVREVAATLGRLGVASDAVHTEVYEL